MGGYQTFPALTIDGMLCVCLCVFVSIFSAKHAYACIEHDQLCVLEAVFMITAVRPQESLQHKCAGCSCNAAPCVYSNLELRLHVSSSSDASLSDRDCKNK